MSEIPLKPCQLCNRVRQILNMHVEDRTVRKWRALAFIERKRFYTETDAQQIAEYAVLTMQTGSLEMARTILCERLEKRYEQKQECINVGFATVT